MQWSGTSIRFIKPTVPWRPEVLWRKPTRAHGVSLRIVVEAIFSKLDHNGKQTNATMHISRYQSCDSSRYGWNTLWMIHSLIVLNLLRVLYHWMLSSRKSARKQGWWSLENIPDEGCVFHNGIQSTDINDKNFKHRALQVHITTSLPRKKTSKTS